MSESVTAIGDKAFWGCESLKEISMPESVTAIGDSTFYRCVSLQEIKIPTGCRTKFEKLLPDYKDKLVEV